MRLELECRHRFAGGFQLDVALSVARPFAALFGPSGAGKTSLLAHLAGTLRAQHARLVLDGKLLVDTTTGVFVPPERRGLGVVFQEPLLFPHRDVEANLRYGQRRQGPGPAIDFDAAVAALELGGLLHRRPNELSGGQRHRVALGRALLSRPRMLLLDEPLAALDAPLRGRVLDYLQRLAADGDLPVLYVTHSQAEVYRAAEWVAVLDAGRVVAQGPPAEALARPEVLGWTGAARPVNLVRLDTVDRDGDRRLARIGAQTLLLPPGGAETPRFAAFSPTEVILSRQDVQGVSARNHLRGEVCRIVASGEAVFVAVDLGQVIWAEITPAALKELGLKVKDPVVCLLKTHSLELVD